MAEAPALLHLAGGERKRRWPNLRINPAERVCAGAAEEAISSCAAEEGVAAKSAHEAVVAAAAEERVVAAVAEEGVRAAEPGDGIIAFAAEQQVVATAAFDLVISPADVSGDVVYQVGAASAATVYRRKRNPGPFGPGVFILQRSVV